MWINETLLNKTVLLRERKRHTARRVASTPYVVLTGNPPPPPARVPPPSWPGWGGYPAGGVPDQGTPPARVPPPGRVPPWAGYPPARVPPPQLDLARYPPPPLDLAGYPPRLPHGILGNVAKHYGVWVPPPCGQTNKVKVLPSRRTTYAGGKYEL